MVAEEHGVTGKMIPGDSTHAVMDFVRFDNREVRPLFHPHSASVRAEAKASWKQYVLCVRVCPCVLALPS